MLKEALQELTRLAVASAGPRISEADPTKTYAVAKSDGTHEFIGGRVPWRKHVAHDLETVVAFAEKFDGSAIWYDRTKIVCLTKEDERFDRITLPMIHSEQIVKLAELERGKPRISQRDLLFLLRTVFTQDGLAKFPRLIEQLRKVSFTAGTAADTNIQRGKASIGKTVTAEASFPEPPPEQVTLTVPVFNNAFARGTVDVVCALEIYETEQNFQLFPLPGQIEAAYSTAESRLCKAICDLKTGDSPVYYGDPK